MDLISAIKRTQLDGLIESLEQMVKEKFICDFVIKAEDDEFPVHRVVLAGSTKYFKAMFSSEMKEAKQGLVEILGVPSHAMQTCIDFMYSGIAKITSENVEETLSASTLMQLDGLADLCFHFLEANLGVTSCLTVKRLSSFYSRDGVKKSAEDVIIEHFDEVILQAEFSEISVEDLKHYINSSERGPEISWDAVTIWMSGDLDTRKTLFPELLVLLKIQEYPFRSIDRYLKEEKIMDDCEDFKGVLVEHWFSDLVSLGGNLACNNYYKIKYLTESHELPNKSDVAEHLSQFFRENFESLWREDEFLEVKKEELLPIFQNTVSEHSSEKVKWTAAVKWVKHDKDRLEMFPVLFSSINFNLLPNAFIEQFVLSETMVKESHHCKDTLLNFFTKTTSASHITYLRKSSKMLASFDPLNNRSQVLLTEVRDGIGVSNVRGDLYLISKRRFCRLNRSGTWTVLPFPPNPVGMMSKVLTFQECIYVIARSSLQWFNPMTNRWTDHTKLDSGKSQSTVPWVVRKGACFAASSNSLYQFGGYTEIAIKESSSPFSSPQPVKSGLFGSSKQPCFGQFTFQNTPKPTVLSRTASCSKANILCTSNNSWITLPDMNVERTQASAVVLRETVWVVGGGDESVEAYHPLLNTWTLMPNMPRPRKRIQSCVVNDRLFVIGGSQRFVSWYDEQGKRWVDSKAPYSSSGQLSCCTYTPPSNVEKLDVKTRVEKELDSTYGDCDDSELEDDEEEESDEEY